MKGLASFSFVYKKWFHCDLRSPNDYWLSGRANRVSKSIRRTWFRRRSRRKRLSAIRCVMSNATIPSLRENFESHRYTSKNSYKYRNSALPSLKQCFFRFFLIHSTSRNRFFYMKITDLIFIYDTQFYFVVLTCNNIFIIHSLSASMLQTNRTCWPIPTNGLDCYFYQARMDSSTIASPDTTTYL